MSLVILQSLWVYKYNRQDVPSHSTGYTNTIDKMSLVILQSLWVYAYTILVNEIVRLVPMCASLLSRAQWNPGHGVATL